MSDGQRKMILGLLLNGVGLHQASWRRPSSRVEEAFSLSLCRDAVDPAEKAKIHLIFLADSPLHSQKLFPVRPLRFLESVTLGSALAAVSEHIGIVCTLSTTFTEPYNVARQLTSLDHISNGRAGWNIVTSYDGAQHFSDTNRGGCPNLPRPGACPHREIGRRDIPPHRSAHPAARAAGPADLRASGHLGERQEPRR